MPSCAITRMKIHPKNNRIRDSFCFRSYFERAVLLAKQDSYLCFTIHIHKRKRQSATGCLLVCKRGDAFEKQSRRTV